MFGSLAATPGSEPKQRQVLLQRASPVRNTQRSPSSSAVAAVLFDLDNTLLLEDESTALALREACAAIAGRTGIDVDVMVVAAREAADDLFRRSAVFAYADAIGVWWGEALWGEFVGETAGLAALRAFVPDFRRRVWSRALSAAGVADEGLVEKAIRAFVSARRRTQLVDPDAEAVVRDLARDHRLALVTNGAPDVQREKLSHTSLAAWFAVSIISGEIGIGKPDPGIFEAALTELGVAPQNAVMVGDSPSRDVAGAHAAGLRVIWIDRGSNEAAPSPRPTPDARVTRLGEVRAALAAVTSR